LTDASFDPPHRLVMTLGWLGDESIPPGSTLVEITLTPEGAGTRLRLVHTGLPDEPAREIHGAGWNLYTTKLAALFKKPLRGRSFTRL
jgi:uncharacterized protein YndB with AHSA1/START domain